jgi:PAS domain S-box-containing protein
MARSEDLKEELRVAEEELTQQSEELEASRARLEAERERYGKLFEFAPEAYVVTDVGGTVREVNRAAVELLQAGPAGVLGKPFAVFVATEYRGSFRHGLGRIPQMGHLKDWELRLQPRQGPVLVVSANVVIMPSSGTEGRELLWSLRDVSERRRLQSELREVIEDVARMRQVVLAAATTSSY